MRILLLLIGLLPAIALAQGSPSLDSLKDKSRVLLVFAQTDQDPNFQQQITILRHHAQEMKDRDLILLPVLIHIGAATSADTLRTVHPPTASDAEQIDLRRRFHIDTARFTVILIGKDGGEKLREHSPIPIQKLNATIDAMPMRRDEMRSRNPQ
jgi:hypothetical protein